MNKKFYTLVAGLLLAGGLFTTANAIKVADVANNGQYYRILRIAQYQHGSPAGTWDTDQLTTTSKLYLQQAEPQGLYVTDNANSDAALWKVEKVGNLYTFTNKLGQKLTYTNGQDKFYVTTDNPDFSAIITIPAGHDINQFFLSETDKVSQLQMNYSANNANNSVAFADFKTSTGNKYTLAFDLEKVAGSAYTDAELNAFNGPAAGFNLSIGDLNAEEEFVSYSNLQGNVFTGTLKASTAAVEGATLAAGNYYLMSGNKYIVLLTATWSEFNTNQTGTPMGYKFATMTKAELVNQLKRDAAGGADASAPKILTAQFRISKNVNAAAYIEVAAINGATEYELYVSEYNKAYYLTVANSTTANLPEYNNATNKTYVKLGSDKLVDLKDFAVKDSYYTIIEKKSGKVLGVPSCDATTGTFLSADEVQADMPEGMWALVQTTDGSFQFVNRENGTVSYEFSKLYYTNTKNVYANGDKEYVIEAHAIKDLKEGYANFATKDTKYNLGIYSPVWGASAFFTENHADKHQIGLDRDEANAAGWKLVANADVRKYNKTTDAVEVGTDSLYVIHTLPYWGKDKKGVEGWQTTTDTLKIVSYKLVNAANNEPLYYAGDNYACDKDKAAAANFVFKKVGDNYNMVEVNLPKEATDKTTDHASFVGTKVYGGDSATKGLLDNTCMYERTENDLVSVKVIDAPEYLSLNMGDTIKIFRSEYAQEESNVLYEKAGFLGVGNAVEFAKINPALYVDTAYTDDYRPEYLLAVNVNRVDTTYKCNVPAHAHLFHKADTTFGRFLVNLADSAIANTDLHTNKFVYNYNGTNLAKLGFVKGFHTENTLFIETPEGKINVATAAPQFGKYAFRITDNETNEFVIETAFKEIAANAQNKAGYISYVNGNVVVTDKLEDAERFNLKAENRIPTANEGVNAEAGVSVVAVDGAIIVKNAAGKKVAISNILGKAIANTTIASDYETIAAPAGIAVVAVEGEEAVKVVVK